MKKYVIIVVACALIGIGFLYRTGYRIGIFGIGKAGTLSLTIPMQNTDIIIDESQKITTTKDSEEVRIHLYPGQHQIIVSRAGYFPWTKKFTILKGSMLTVEPLFVTQNTTGQIITERDPEYYTIKSSVLNTSLPTKTLPRTSLDGNKKVWVEDNIILIQTGDTIHTVIAPEPLITHVEFYKNRSDVLLFSAGDSVFVIETEQNTENIQNILPIFKGKKPLFTGHDLGSIYVFDSPTLMAVVI